MKKNKGLLGIKQMTEDPWARAIPEKYIPGHIIKGKIAKVTNFGAFVELEPDLEGLLHISELADHKIDKPQDIVQQGDEVEVKILRVDNESRKIGLSLRRVQWAAEEEAAKTVQQTRPVGVQTVVSDADMDKIVKPQDEVTESESAQQESKAAEAEAGDTDEPKESPEPAPGTPSGEQTETNAVEAETDDAVEEKVSEDSKQGQADESQEAESADSDSVRSESDSSSTGGALGTSNGADNKAGGDSGSEKQTDNDSK
jgi:ribosomal protein S1